MERDVRPHRSRAMPARTPPKRLDLPRRVASRVGQCVPHRGPRIDAYADAQGRGRVVRVIRKQRRADPASPKRVARRAQYEFGGLNDDG
jgi:hypothetical protein